MTLAEIKSIMNESFAPANQKLLVEEQYPDKTKAIIGKPYKSIEIKHKKKVDYWLCRIEEKHLTWFSTNPNPPKDIKCFCDYILFIDYHDDFFIFFIEIKGNDTSHAKEQIIAAKYFIDYIKKSAERISIDIQNIKERKIIIKNREKYKPKTKYNAFTMIDEFYLAYCKNQNDHFLIDDFVK